MIGSKEHNKLLNLAQCRRDLDSSERAFLLEQPIAFFDAIVDMVETEEIRKPTHICGALRLLAFLRGSDRHGRFLTTVRACGSSTDVRVRSYCANLLVMLYRQRLQPEDMPPGWNRNILEGIRRIREAGIDKDSNELVDKWVGDHVLYGQ